MSKTRTKEECFSRRGTLLYETDYIKIIEQEINELKEKSEEVHNGTVLPLEQQIKALKEYALHKRDCEMRSDSPAMYAKHIQGYSPKCTCGLDKLLNQE